MHLCDLEKGFESAARLSQNQQKLSIACWNVRSLVENEGSLETARVSKDELALNNFAHIGIEKV